MEKIIKKGMKRVLAEAYVNGLYDGMKQAQDLVNKENIDYEFNLSLSRKDAITLAIKEVLK